LVIISAEAAALLRISWRWRSTSWTARAWARVRSCAL
jgi:hypothetical protein